MERAANLNGNANIGRKSFENSQDVKHRAKHTLLTAIAGTENHTTSSR